MGEKLHLRGFCRKADFCSTSGLVLYNMCIERYVSSLRQTPRNIEEYSYLLRSTTLLTNLDLRNHVLNTSSLQRLSTSKGPFKDCDLAFTSPSISGRFYHFALEAVISSLGF